MYAEKQPPLGEPGNEVNNDTGRHGHTCGNTLAEGEKPFSAYGRVTGFPPRHSPEETVTTPPLGPTAPLDDTPEDPDPTDRRRVPWRVAGLGLTSFGTPIGIWATAPLLGRIAARNRDGGRTRNHRRRPVRQAGTERARVPAPALDREPAGATRPYRTYRADTWPGTRGTLGGPRGQGRRMGRGTSGCRRAPRSGAWINGVMSDERTARGPVERPR